MARKTTMENVLHLQGSVRHIGDLLAKNKPFAFVLSNEKVAEFCSACFRPAAALVGAGLKTCSKCQFERYCNRECQKRAFSNHKRECHMIAGVKSVSTQHNTALSGIPDTSVRLFYRVVQRLKISSQEDTGDLCWTSFSDLMSHEKDIQGNKDRIGQLMKLVKTYSVYYNEDTSDADTHSRLLRLAMQITINSISITSQEMRTIGVGTYLSFSVFDHCCDPMAVLTFRGTEAQLRLVRKPLYKGEKISLMYAAHIPSNRERRDFLKESYYFECECHWCTDVTRDKLLHSAVCSTPLCEGLVLSEEACCPKCHKSYEQLTQTEAADIQKLSKCTKSFDSEAPTNKKLDAAFQCLQTTCLSTTHHVCLNFMDALFYRLLDEERWKEAGTVGKLLLKAMKQVKPTMDADFGMMYYKVGRLLINTLDQFTEGTGYLKEARSILNVTHGSDSSLVEELSSEIMNGEMAALSH